MNRIQRFYQILKFIYYNLSNDIIIPWFKFKK